MKKLLVAIFAAVLGVASLFAGDAEDVKGVILKDMELGAQGDFMAMLALRTPDYVESGEHGTFSYEHFKWSVLMLDGRHPEEFVLTLWAISTRGTQAKPTEEQMAKIRELAANPEFLKTYQEAFPDMVAAIKADQALQLKTTKFVSVDVDGDSATVVGEYDTNASGAVKHKTATVTLRKVDGAWKICKAVSKPVRKE